MEKDTTAARTAPRQKSGFSIIRSYLGYGAGAVGLDLSYGMFYTYLSAYLTDQLHISEFFLLVLTPFARLWDGINDPMMGTIVDRTKTKFGKYRPWILTGATLNAVVLSLLFSNPFGLHSAGLCVYVGILYVLWGMTNTLADIPYWSMVPSFSNVPRERSLISTVARTFSGLGQGIVSVFTPYMLLWLSPTGEENTQSYSRWTLICSAFLILFAALCVSTTKETHVIRSDERFSFKKAFQIVKNNDQLLVFMLFAMISNAGWYLTSSTAKYFFNHVVGDSTAQSGFALFGGVGSMAGLLVIPVLTKYISKRKTYQLSLLITAFGYAGMFAGGITQRLPVLDLFYVFASVGISSMFVAQTIFLSDIVDYGEIKMGFRSESITFSMKGFLQKMAYTAQTIILYLGLGLSGYDETLSVNNPQVVKTAITVMMLLIPAALLLLSLLVFSKKFRLHGTYMDEITRKIDEKRALHPHSDAME